MNDSLHECVDSLHDSLHERVDRWHERVACKGADALREPTANRRQRMMFVVYLEICQYILLFCCVTLYSIGDF